MPLAKLNTLCQYQLSVGWYGFPDPYLGYLVH